MLRPDLWRAKMHGGEPLPSSIRGVMWQILSGAAESSEQLEIARVAVEEAVQNGAAAPTQALAAFRYNHILEESEALVYIASLVEQTSKTPQDALVLLERVLEQRQLAGLYDEQSPVFAELVTVMTNLLLDLHGDLVAHTQTIEGLDLPRLIVSTWFPNMFANRFPTSVVDWIVDLVLCEDHRVLFAAALLLVQKTEEQIREGTTRGQVEDIVANAAEMADDTAANIQALFVSPMLEDEALERATVQRNNAATVETPADAPTDAPKEKEESLCRIS